MIYLDNAATSRFKPTSAIDALLDALKNSANFSRATHKDALSFAEKIVQFRALIANTIHLDSINRIIFTQNASESLNMAILGFSKSYNKHFHIITTAFDHNSALRPIHYLHKINRANYTIIYPERDLKIDIDKIYFSISKHTKLIVVNHQSNVTSSKIDLDKLKDICAEKKVHLIVDAAQSFGREFIDMKGISALCIAGHKSLLGPQGVGILALSNSFNISPIKFGGSGINSEWLDQPLIYPEGYEVGTLNCPAILGLHEAFKYTLYNQQKINKKIDNLSYYLHEKLRQNKSIEVISYGFSSCFCIKHLNCDQGLLFNYLNDNDVATRFGLHCAPLIHSYLNTLKSGLVRISIGYNNTLEEMDYLVDLLKSFDHIN